MKALLRYVVPLALVLAAPAAHALTEQERLCNLEALHGLADPSCAPPNQPPVAVLDAAPLSGEAPLAVDFDAGASSDADGVIVSYDWDFGDGQTAAGAVQNHAYAAGAWTATLTVTDDQGAADAVTEQILAMAPPPPGEAIAVLPLESDWTDQGVLIARGAVGDGDYRFAGLGPCAQVRLADGSWLGYYIAAPGNRPWDAGDPAPGWPDPATGEPAYRQIHAMTSADGLTGWTKHPGNPVLSYVNEVAGATGETGIFGCAAYRDAAGDVIVLAGTMPEFSPGAVHEDISMANCGADGRTCGALAMILSHGDPRVFNSYDEMGPGGVWTKSNGDVCLVVFGQVSPKWSASWACGPALDDLTEFGAWTGSHAAHAGGDVIDLGQGNMAVAFLDDPRGRIDWYTFQRDDPGGTFAGPVMTYDWIDSASGATCWRGVANFSLRLDRNLGLWVMPHMDGCWNSINDVFTGVRVRTAPVAYQ